MWVLDTEGAEDCLDRALTELRGMRCSQPVLGPFVKPLHNRSEGLSEAHLTICSSSMTCECICTYGRACARLESASGDSESTYKPVRALLHQLGPSRSAKNGRFAAFRTVVGKTWLPCRGHCPMSDSPVSFQNPHRWPKALSAGTPDQPPYGPPQVRTQPFSEEHGFLGQPLMTLGAWGQGCFINW